MVKKGEPSSRPFAIVVIRRFFNRRKFETIYTIGEIDEEVSGVV